MPPLSVRIRRPDGTIRAVEARGRKLVDEQGRVRIVGICLDVTARRELEDRLHQASKMEAVGTLAAGVAHDFNNFLTVIVCQLDELRSAVSAAQQAPLDDARHAAEQCALLTEKLLAFARKQPPSFSRLDLGATLRRVETLLRRVCPPAVGLTIDVPQGPVYVRSESNQLESLLMNLALNARDAMPNGGTLGFTVDQVSLEAGQAPLHAGAKPGRYARIQVKDTGIGIAPEHLPRIFEPYFSTKAVGQGTGLGLALGLQQRAAPRRRSSSREQARTRHHLLRVLARRLRGRAQRQRSQDDRPRFAARQSARARGRRRRCGAPHGSRRPPARRRASPPSPTVVTPSSSSAAASRSTSSSRT